jgi:hypothetical protein
VNGTTNGKPNDRKTVRFRQEAIFPGRPSQQAKNIHEPSTNQEDSIELTNLKINPADKSDY